MNQKVYQEETKNTTIQVQPITTALQATGLSTLTQPREPNLTANHSTMTPATFRTSSINSHICTN